MPCLCISRRKLIPREVRLNMLRGERYDRNVYCPVPFRPEDPSLSVLGDAAREELFFLLNEIATRENRNIL